MDASIEQAVLAWQKLYGGELQALPAPAPGVEAVGVRRDDFRSDPGNWPRILHHRRRTGRVLVLIHGLKDSPGYLDQVASRFAARGVNVVLPLLPGHGRRDPVSAMRRASVRSWRSTVDRTVEIAAALGDELSIGGLSTGGALAIDLCLRNPPAIPPQEPPPPAKPPGPAPPRDESVARRNGLITGKVFLFAAALGLPPSARLVLSSRLMARLCDAWTERKAGRGIGGNPLKYSRRFFAAGRQVHLLIQDLRRRAGDDLERLGSPRRGTDATLRDRIFVAHSEADATIPAGAVKCLVDPGDPGQHHLVPAALDVAHAELVLAEAMTYDNLRTGEPDPPRANPEFEPMIAKALAFLER